MKKVAKFYKVSYSQFEKDYLDTFPDMNINIIKNMYDEIKLPTRATQGSAGYDFFAPFAFSLKPSQTIKIPTGIKVKIAAGWVLAIFPRSGLGFKYRIQLNNTVGIIDSDYIESDNEGHIFIKITNDSNENKIVFVSKGYPFAQGIFFMFGITEDDEVTAKRNGGFGSTSKN